MKKMIATLAALGVAGAMAGPALAQDETMAPEGLDFATVDADVSGDVTLEEIQAVAPDFTEDLYIQADLDASGSLDEAEYSTLVESGALEAPVE